jgi:hypothetical protein
MWEISTGKMVSLQQKTSGISYNELTLTTNVSENINITTLMNSADGAIRNNVAVGESVTIGSNLIVNSGNTFTNNIFAIFSQTIIQNTILTNAKIDNVYISSKSLAFISTLSSDVQLQLDTYSKKIGPSGKDGVDSTVAGPAGRDGEDSTVAGPARRDGADSTVPGPARRDGVDSTVAGPAGRDGADSTIP